MRKKLIYTLFFTMMACDSSETIIILMNRVKSVPCMV